MAGPDGISDNRARMSIVAVRANERNAGRGEESEWTVVCETDQSTGEPLLSVIKQKVGVLTGG